MRDFANDHDFLAFSVELERIARLSDYPLLKKFMFDISKWELLLHVCVNFKSGNSVGITEYYDLLQNRTKSRLTLTNFLRDRVVDGTFDVLIRDGRKNLAPSQDILAELSRFLLGPCHKDRKTVSPEDVDPRSTASHGH